MLGSPGFCGAVSLCEYMQSPHIKNVIHVFPPYDKNFGFIPGYFEHIKVYSVYCMLMWLLI